MKNNFGKLSNTFYRLAKLNNHYGYTIYDFHTSYLKVNEVYHWITTCVQDDINDMGEKVGYSYGNHEYNNIEKNYGNAWYLKLKENGFVFVGKFEQDVLGRERRI